ncbi:MAG: NADH-quinone oxidoreductase subunit G [Gammaproteobacteria bacterium]|nr:MAG: NADH-quinone oxidoreductase subunit G [Gammaproteobacteria bacterium]
MTDDGITIEVNGKSLPARKGQMLIEVTDANGIYVPRFCYHKKLTVAANCRMCLVEVEKAPKPVPACATPVMNGMKVFTRSPLAVEAQKSVMEFLLINHPLDCPICDQGGECELQDLAMGYGRDVSRYQERKRVVGDRDIGPLVQTEMTRCIHCTRCVRFGEEIAGLRELGATGRGEHTLIGTYVEKAMESELSGNVIDLCPVGALTSKPFRFSARTWEMRQMSGIAPHDGIGSNLHFHVKGQTVKRVVPAENESINEVWLSDRDRFSYEGLYSDDRLSTPMVKQGEEWREVDWMTAFEVIKDRLGLILNAGGPERIGALAAPTSTTEELYLLQKLMRGLGSNNIDHRLRQTDFGDDTEAPIFPWLGQSIVELEQLDAALLIGGNVRKQQPLLNHRLRKAAGKGAAIMAVNPVDYEFNYPLAARIVAGPGQIPAALAGIVQALLEAGRTLPDPSAAALLNGIQADANHRAIADRLLKAGKAAVLLGDLAMNLPGLPAVRYLSGIIAAMTGARFGYAGTAANGSGAWLAGAVPHRLPGGQPSPHAGLNARAMLERRLSAYVLLNVEPEFDCHDPVGARNALGGAQCVIAITAYRTSAMNFYADVLLPAAIYAENEGSFINVEGREQRFGAAVRPQGEARPAWKILRVLGESFCPGAFNLDDIEAVHAAIHADMQGIEPRNLDAWLRPDSLPWVNGALQRLTEVPIYSGDPLVRRARSLQRTHDAGDGMAHIAPGDAGRQGITNGDRILLKQGGETAELPAVIDARLPEGTLLLQAGNPACFGLGPETGEIEIGRA